MAKKLQFVVLIAAITVAGIFLWQRFGRGNFNFPKNGETKTETVAIKEESQVAATTSQAAKQPAVIEKKIMVTNGVKHLIPLEEIVGGGPPKDGIPSIDEPKFVSVGEASKWLKDEEPGIAISLNGVNRFYPYQILVWHEIVNDTFADQRVLVTYCPLCLTGIVFDPVVKGERVEFGTSGKLWKSNLVMYDRKTDSLWSQVLGEAVVGEMTGTKLKIISSDQVRFGAWKKANTGGQVLSRDTGTTRFYGSNPYGGYFSAADFALSLANFKDKRLNPDAFVFGLIVGDKAKAYYVEAVKAKGTVVDVFEGITFVLRYDKDLDVVRIYQSVNGQEHRINPFSAFWFSWAAAHPDTELYK